MRHLRITHSKICLLSAKVAINFNQANGEEKMNIANRNKLKLYIFYCSNCFDGDEFNRLISEDEGAEHKIISLPCSGKADLLYLLKAFETGADGLVIVTCPKNECHYLEGNLRAPKRAEEANAILEETGMGGNRITVLRMNENGIGEIVLRMTAFREKIRGLPSYTAGRVDAGTSIHASLPVCG
jgi:F420-non-reducing hydrogenase iron-sulfur subunit